MRFLFMSLRRPMQTGSGWDLTQVFTGPNPAGQRGASAAEKKGNHMERHRRLRPPIELLAPHPSNNAAFIQQAHSMESDLLFDLLNGLHDLHTGSCSQVIPTLEGIDSTGETGFQRVLVWVLDLGTQQVRNSGESATFRRNFARKMMDNLLCFSAEENPVEASWGRCSRCQYTATDDGAPHPGCLFGGEQFAS